MFTLKALTLAYDLEFYLDRSAIFGLIVVAAIQDLLITALFIKILSL